MFDYLDESGPKVYVVIPTRNRENELLSLLEQLHSQSMKPKKVFIIDSSDSFTPQHSQVLDIEHIHTTIRSAARQRNIGLELLKSLELTEILCCFLDDDVSIPVDYIERLCQVLLSGKDIAGVSGIAISEGEKFVKDNWLLRILGFSGEPGSLSKAAINIPVRTGNQPVLADWLIGCSLWRLSAIEALCFQEDFSGASVFEDVLFSVEAGVSAKLLVDPTITIQHKLSVKERPATEEFVRQWVGNRYRLKRVAPEKFSDTRFWLANLLVVFKRTLFEFNVNSIKGLHLACKDIRLKTK